MQQFKSITKACSFVLKLEATSLSIGGHCPHDEKQYACMRPTSGARLALCHFAFKQRQKFTDGSRQSSSLNWGLIKHYFKKQTTAVNHWWKGNFKDRFCRLTKMRQGTE